LEADLKAKRVHGVQRLPHLRPDCGRFAY
jgi:hypothetical protein